MLSFDQYLMRHGEHGVLYIVEQVEKVDGIRYRGPVSLEDRWNVLFGESNLFPAAPAIRLVA